MTAHEQDAQRRRIAGGVRALDQANRAFETLPDEYLDELSQAAVKQARESLRYQPFVALNIIEVSRRSCSHADEPSSTPTLSLTAS